MFDLTKPLDSSSTALLTVLTPGLLAFALFHAISRRREKIEAVNAIVYSLALTLVVQAMWVTAKLPGSFIPTPDAVGLCICSVITAIILVFLEDSAFFHNTLQSIGISRNSPWATIWQSAFRQILGRESGYAVLHLKDQRRVMGHVRGCSDDQKDGHIVLDKACWLTDKEPVFAIGVLVFPSNEVAFVELLPTSKGNTHDETFTTTSAAAPTSTTDEGRLVGTNSAASTPTTSATSASSAIEIEPTHLL